MTAKPPPSIDTATVERLGGRLQTLYGGGAEACLEKLLRLVESRATELPTSRRRGWDERDIVLITYGDQIQCAGQHPLRTMRDFLVSQGLDQLIRTVHVLPFYPYSSDDGFSVIDYRAVDPALGDWQDVRDLGERFELMFDLVLNHCSSRSRWFDEYAAGHEPFVRFFIEADPAADLSRVTRPRSLPLLTAVETSNGTRHVWTTFSADQVDLNFANPDVLLEMVDIFLYYIQQGARIIRLDAVAYLWKQIGSNCIHLPQTHEVVKLLRDLAAAVAPHVLLLTETNVPHAENISYLGAGDEAHMVYQFSLPPLLLDAMLSGDARPLMAWLSALPPAPPHATFFNFTASHDGVGVRPLEGLVSGERLAELVDGVQARGGLVSTRRQPDGSDAAYELNVSYVSALGAPHGMDPGLQARRFLTTQALMLSLRGMPAIYIHSLLGTTNDDQGVRESGQPRRINRRKFRMDELAARLADADSLSARIFAGYRRLLSVRVRQPAFHPDAQQSAWYCEEPWLIALMRTSIDGKQIILVLANVGDRQQTIELSRFNGVRFDRELLSDRRIVAGQMFKLDSGEIAWLEAGR